jgi:DNA-binding MarR family transcriptional regulator
MGCELPSVNATLDRCVMISLAVRAHCLIGKQFGSDLFSMPALNMLFDLYARKDRRPRSLTSLSGASKAPARTALRIINRMVERNLLLRTPDPRDQRRINVELSPEGLQLLDAYFDGLVELLAGPDLRILPP